MSDKFWKFIEKEGIAVQYWRNYYDNDQRRNEWHASSSNSEYEFFDNQNAHRYISGAFRWGATPEGFEFWQRQTYKWKEVVYCKPVLSKRTITI